MSYQDGNRIEHAARSAMAYSLEADSDAERRHFALVVALLPALAILLAAATVLARLISA